MERGEARIFKRIKRATRRRLTAVLMVMMMTATLFSSMGTVSAATVTDFTVTINFYAFDQTTPAAPELNSGNSSRNYHVVVTLKDKETNEVAGYGFAVIEDINQTTQTLHITEFWTTEENDEGWRITPKWETLEYDPALYTASSVRLYYGSSPAYQSEWNPGVGYSSLITQQDTIDGYIFMSSSVNTETAVINLYKGTQEYVVRVEFDPEATEITEDDGYYILVSAKHKSGSYSYYYAPLVTDGTSTTVDFEVKNGDGAQSWGGTTGDWIDMNGNATTEKYTGNWSPVTVRILKAVPGKQPTAKQAIDGNFVQETTSVKDCSVSYEGVTKVRDEENCVVENCDVIKLTKTSPTADYNYLTVLGDAVNYGIVSGKITQSNHSEGNFATKVYALGTGGDFNFDPDLSGNGTEQVPGNYLVGRIESDKMRFGNETPATAAVFVGKGSKDKVQNEAASENVIVIPMEEPEINSAIDDMISHMKRVSAAMAAKDATTEPIVVDNTVYLDTTGFEDGVTIYIDADAYNGPGKPFSKDSGLKITMKPNQTIVFNFKEATEVVLSKAVVDLGDGTGEHTTNTINGAFGEEQNIYADKINQRLVWNCPKATSIDTHISGGIYLAPRNDAKMTLGDTTTGWGVCAGEVIMGKTSEYHFVYQGLKKENGVTLKAFKQVDDTPATATEKFKFALERYNADLGAFEPVQTDVLDGDGVPTGEKTDLLFENDGETIVMPVTIMTGGRNIFRITEVGKSDSTTGTYTLDDKAIYAQFDVTINDLTDDSAMIPGPVTYYKKFENGEVREKMNEADRTFHNTTVTTNNDDPNGNGTNDDPNGNGTNDDPNGNGTNDDPNGNGTNDNPNGNGTNDNPNGNGTNDNPNGNGTNDNPNGNGTNDDPNGNGTNDDPNGNGTNDNPNGNGTNDNPNGNGTNDNPNGNGTNDDPNGNGTNDNPNGNGTNDNPNGNGTNDNPNGNGTNDNPNGNGTNDNPNGNGTNDDPNGNGTNDNPNSNGTNDNPNGNGTNDNPNGNGTNDNPNGNGTNDNPDGNGTNDNPNGSGTNDNPNGNGTNDNANGNGTIDDTNGNGTNDNAGGNGTSDTTAGNTTQNYVGDEAQNAAGEAAQSTAGDAGQSNAGRATQNTAGGTGQNTTSETAQNAAGEAAQSATGNVGQNTAGSAGQASTGEAGQSNTGGATQNGNEEVAKSGTGEVAQNPAVETTQAATGKTNTETGSISGQGTGEKTNRDIPEVTGEGSAEQPSKTARDEISETSVKTGDTITNSLIILMLLLSTLTIITVMVIKTDRAKVRC